MKEILKEGWFFFKNKNKIISLNLYSNLFKATLFKKIVVFQNGSNKFSYSNKNKEIIDTLLECKDTCIIVPNSFAFKDRPTYTNPDKIENYMTVLNLRDKELKFTMKQLNKLEPIHSKIFLFGNSEGGKSVIEYNNKFNFSLFKIVMSYSYENNYYNNIKPKKISNSEIPILNLIGSKDEYFSSFSKYNNDNLNIIGNSSLTLSDYPNLKTVIFSNEKHYLISNENVKSEIKNFIE